MRNIWHDIDPHAITPTHFTAVIEIPAGSKKKYELDKKTGLPNREKLNVYISIIRRITALFRVLMPMTAIRSTFWSFARKRSTPWSRSTATPSARCA